LKRVLDDDDNTFTAMEMAEVARCSKRHIYKVVDMTESTELRQDKLEKINQYLTEHGEFRVLYAQMDADLRVVRALYGESTGTTSDDVMDAIKALTGIDDAYDDQAWEEARKLLNDLKHEVADLETELARAEARH
jgi:hypothetical protein